MVRNRAFEVDWSLLGPQVVEWMGRQLPLRHSMSGLYEDCAAAFSVTEPNLNADRIRLWLMRRCPEWNALKNTLGTANGASALTGAAAATSSPKPVSTSLLDRLREKTLNAKRAMCPVCTKLSPETRRQIEDAKTKGYPLREILALLAEDGYVIRSDEFTAHYTQRH